jgi:NAD(P)H-flavin reductase
MQCRVVELAFVTHDVLWLRLTIEAGGPYIFSAGQFAKPSFLARETRAVSNRPGEPRWSFTSAASA